MLACVEDCSCCGAVLACGMSEAVAALFGTAGVALATSDGDGLGAAGNGVACACSGAGVIWAGRGACVVGLASALMRACMASEA